MNGPAYRGTFVGQSVNLGGVYKPKKVAWQQVNEDGDKEWRHGRVQRFSPHVFVWNGTQWMANEEFDSWASHRMLLAQAKAR